MLLVKSLHDYDGDTVRTNAKKMTVTSILTTPLVDHQGDIVEPVGVDLSIHKKNPVVLYEHRLSPETSGPGYPIGQAMDPDGSYTVHLGTYKGKPALIGTTYFAKNLKVADQVFGLIHEGLIRGTSIGFSPIAGGTRTLKKSLGGQRGSFHFLRCQMHEYSHTSRPVNAEALTVHVEKSRGRLDPLILKSLNPWLLKSGQVVLSGYEAQQPEPTEPSPLQSWARMLSEHTQELAETCRGKIEQNSDDPIAPALTEVCDRLDGCATDAGMLSQGTIPEEQPEPETVAKSAIDRNLGRPDIAVDASGNTVICRHGDDSEDDERTEAEQGADERTRTAIQGVANNIAESLRALITDSGQKMDLFAGTIHSDENSDGMKSLTDLLKVASSLASSADRIAAGEFLTDEDRAEKARLQKSVEKEIRLNKKLERRLRRYERRVEQMQPRQPAQPEVIGGQY